MTAPSDPDARPSSRARASGSAPPAGAAVVPDVAARMLDAALVAELSVVDHRGRVASYPLIPLWNGAKILMSSSVLFSRKLEHIKANPLVSVSVTDPTATPVDDFTPVTIQGRARIIEDDLHEGWMELLPLWKRKEPVIEKLVKQRFAIPLFFERSIIEITPERVLTWTDPGSAPTVTDLGAAA